VVHVRHVWEGGVALGDEGVHLLHQALRVLVKGLQRLKRRVDAVHNRGRVRHRDALHLVTQLAREELAGTLLLLAPLALLIIHGALG
jgi:hypothetical protein